MTAIGMETVLSPGLSVHGTDTSPSSVARVTSAATPSIADTAAVHGKVATILSETLVSSSMNGISNHLGKVVATPNPSKQSGGNILLVDSLPDGSFPNYSNTIASAPTSCMSLPFMMYTSEGIASPFLDSDPLEYCSSDKWYNFSEKDCTIPHGIPKSLIDDAVWRTVYSYRYLEEKDTNIKDVIEAAKQSFLFLGNAFIEEKAALFEELVEYHQYVMLQFENYLKRGIVYHNSSDLWKTRFQTVQYGYTRSKEREAMNATFSAASIDSSESYKASHTSSDSVSAPIHTLHVTPANSSQSLSTQTVPAGSACSSTALQFELLTFPLAELKNADDLANQNSADSFKGYLENQYKRRKHQVSSKWSIEKGLSEVTGIADASLDPLKSVVLNAKQWIADGRKDGVVGADNALSLSLAKNASEVEESIKRPAEAVSGMEEAFPMHLTKQVDGGVYLRYEDLNAISSEFSNRESVPFKAPIREMASSPSDNVSVYTVKFDSALKHWWVFEGDSLILFSGSQQKQTKSPQFIIRERLEAFLKELSSTLFESIFPNSVEGGVNIAPPAVYNSKIETLADKRISQSHVGANMGQLIESQKEVEQDKLQRRLSAVTSINTSSKYTFSNSFLTATLTAGKMLVHNVMEMIKANAKEEELAQTERLENVNTSNEFTDDLKTLSYNSQHEEEWLAKDILSSIEFYVTKNDDILFIIKDFNEDAFVLHSLIDSAISYVEVAGLFKSSMAAEVYIITEMNGEKVPLSYIMGIEFTVNYLPAKFEDVFSFKNKNWLGEEEERGDRNSVTLSPLLAPIDPLLVEKYSHGDAQNGMDAPMMLTERDGMPNLTVESRSTTPISTGNVLNGDSTAVSEAYSGVVNGAVRKQEEQRRIELFQERPEIEDSNLNYEKDASGLPQDEEFQRIGRLDTKEVPSSLYEGKSCTDGGPIAKLVYEGRRTVRVHWRNRETQEALVRSFRCGRQSRFPSVKAKAIIFKEWLRRGHFGLNGEHAMTDIMIDALNSKDSTKHETTHNPSAIRITSKNSADGFNFKSNADITQWVALQTPSEAERAVAPRAADDVAVSNATGEANRAQAVAEPTSNGALSTDIKMVSGKGFLELPRRHRGRPSRLEMLQRRMLEKQMIESSKGLDIPMNDSITWNHKPSKRSLGTPRSVHRMTPRSDDRMTPRSDDRMTRRSDHRMSDNSKGLVRQNHLTNGSSIQDHNSVKPPKKSVDGAEPVLHAPSVAGRGSQIGKDTPMQLSDRSSQHIPEVSHKSMLPILPIIRKRGRGRPRKLVLSAPSSKFVINMHPHASSKSLTANYPHHNGVDRAQPTASRGEGSSPALMKRKRGRPPKRKAEIFTNQSLGDKQG